MMPLLQNYYLTYEKFIMDSNEEIKNVFIQQTWESKQEAKLTREELSEHLDQAQAYIDKNKGTGMLNLAVPVVGLLRNILNTLDNDELSSTEEDD